MSWKQNQFLRRDILCLSLKLRKIMSFKPKPSLLKTFVDSQFRVMLVYEFQTKGNSDEDICWGSVWSYVNLWVLNKSEFLWRDFSSLSLKLCKFMSFKEKRILMKTFLESQFRVMWVYEFQTKRISSQDICWVSVWSYSSLRILNKTDFLWWPLVSLSLKLCKFMSFKQNRVLMKTFAESQFGVM